MPLITLLVAMRNEQFIVNFIPLLERENIKVVGHTIKSDDIISQYEELRPDVVLMDVRMYPLNSYEVMKRLLQTDKDAKIIGVSTFFYDADSNELQDTGARGYLIRNHDLSTIVEIITKVYKGGIVFDKVK